MGSYILSIVLSSKKFYPILRALEHLRVHEDLPSDLEIRLWDTKTSQLSLPELDWNKIFLNGYRGYAEPPLFFHYFEEIDVLSILQMDENRAYYIVKDIDKLPWWVSGSPLQAILHVWFRKQGIQLTHSASISNGFSAVLLAGKGGSGKSTTTLGCLENGLYYLGEDYCLLKPDPTPEVFSVYQSAKLQAHTRNLFRGYDHWIVNPDTADQEKALVYYQDMFPNQIIQKSPVRALVALKVGQQKHPLIEEISFESALKELMMSTLSQLPFYERKTLFILQDFVSRLPCYRLMLGSDLEANFHQIQMLLT